jgi:hypothetical protein
MRSGETGKDDDPRGMAKHQGSIHWLTHPTRAFLAAWYPSALISLARSKTIRAYSFAAAALHEQGSLERLLSHVPVNSPERSAGSICSKWWAVLGSNQ